MIEVTVWPTSPFVRKVRIAAAMKGLTGNMTGGSGPRIVFLDVGDNEPAAQALRDSNPLNKIPIARLDDGSLIYDSHVICEYFDSLAPAPRLFPDAGPARWQMLTRAALADGIMDASVLIAYEARFRPVEKHHEPWLAMQQKKIDIALDSIEADIAPWSGAPDYAHLTLASALGYLDLRQGDRWRKTRPNLVVWLDRFAAAVPAYATTTPPK